MTPAPSQFCIYIAPWEIRGKTFQFYLDCITGSSFLVGLGDDPEVKAEEIRKTFREAKHEPFLQT
jgi:hypothetical protein